MKSPPPKLFDMHVHSIHSDGVWSPMQLAELARRSGLAGLCLTDHDTIIPPPVLAEASRGFGVELRSGVELSTELTGRKLHLLAYGFDATNADLLGLCKDLQAKRRRRWWQMAEELRQSKVRLDDVRLARIAARSTPGRLHMARELVHLRAASSLRAAFVQYLNRIERSTESAAVPLHEAVRLIHAAGGIAVLAHPPALLTRETWDALAASGLDGIETGHPSIRGTHRRFLEMVAKQQGFLTTAGSDYHGDEPGEGLGSYTVSLEQLTTLIGSAGPIASSA